MSNLSCRPARRPGTRRAGRRPVRPLLVAFALLPLSVGSALADPDCRCRAPDGEPRELGTVECVSITGSAYLVRCEMSTNTPYWRRLSDEAGCPAA